MMGRQYAALLAAFLLLCQPALGAWNQTIEIYASSKNGLPAQGCEIRITYQKSDNASRSDGLILGKTGKDGRFSASILNTVEPQNEIRRIEVSISSYYWEGETRAIEAGKEEAARLNFTVPYELQPIRIKVLDYRGKAAPGAEVEIFGTGMKEKADQQGNAIFYLPSGFRFAGEARLRDQSQQFASKDMIHGNEGGAIEVWMPAPPPANATKAIPFGLRIYGSDGKPLGRQEIEAKHSEGAVVLTLDDSGFALVQMPPGKLEIAIRRNDYTYSFSFEASQPRNQTVALPPLLKIGNISQLPQGRNCYKLSVNVSDPRSSLPIKVMFLKNASNLTTSADAQLDEQGRFATSFCIFADTTVIAVASNKYEKAESAPLMLQFQPNMPQKPPQEPQNPAALKKEEPKADYSGWIAIGLIGISAAAALYLARGRLQKPLEFINRYVRFIKKILDRKPPQKPAEPAGDSL